MLVTSKQFLCYPGPQRNRVGLSEIIFCMHQINLSPFWINNSAFFIKTFIYIIGFFFKNIL